MAVESFDSIVKFANLLEVRKARIQSFRTAYESLVDYPRTKISNADAERFSIMAEGLKLALEILDGDHD